MEKKRGFSKKFEGWVYWDIAPKVFPYFFPYAINGQYKKTVNIEEI